MRYCDPKPHFETVNCGVLRQIRLIHYCDANFHNMDAEVRERSWVHEGRFDCCPVLPARVGNAAFWLSRAIRLAVLRQTAIPAVPAAGSCECVTAKNRVKYTRGGKGPKTDFVHALRQLQQAHHEPSVHRLRWKDICGRFNDHTNDGKDRAINQEVKGVVANCRHVIL